MPPMRQRSRDGGLPAGEEGIEDLEHTRVMARLAHALQVHQAVDALMEFAGGAAQCSECVQVLGEWKKVGGRQGKADRKMWNYRSGQLGADAVIDRPPAL